MKNSPNQQDLFKRVNMYLDNELSREEEMQLLKELRSNPTYLELLGKERSFREFVKSKVERKTVSPNLIKSIKDRIRVLPA